jgi:hypothetical protein
MPRGASAARRMELNRSRIDQTLAAIGLGMGEFGKEIIDAARAVAPDSPYMPYPTGEGLPNQGGVLVYYDGKKIYSAAGPGRGEPKPPRAARVSRGLGLTLIVGWGFPGRFTEFGTVKETPHPFFTPSVTMVSPRWQQIIGTEFKRTSGSGG